MVTLPLTVCNSQGASFMCVTGTSLANCPLVVRNSTNSDGAVSPAGSVSVTGPLLVSMSNSVGSTSSVSSTLPLTLSASRFWVRTLPEIAPLVVEREISPALAALT